jgi:hypothetical protein
MSFFNRFWFHLEPSATQAASRFCSKFSSLSNVLLLCKPCRSRPSEPWPTTILHLIPSSYISTSGSSYCHLHLSSSLGKFLALYILKLKYQTITSWQCPWGPVCYIVGQTAMASALLSATNHRTIHFMLG